MNMAKKKSSSNTTITTDDLPELPVEGEVREVEVDKSKVFAVAAAKMYKTDASAFKELVSNALGAVHTAIREKQIKKADALIRVSVNDGKVVIEDNGTGISLERLENALIVMGKSANTDGTKHGLMGVGFFGHTKLTDRIVVDTLTADGFGIRVECLKGWNWNELGKSTRTTPGTTIEFESESIREDSEEIRDTLITIGAVSDVRFIAEIEGIGRIGDEQDDIPVPGGMAGIKVNGDRAEFPADRLKLVADAWKSERRVYAITKKCDGFEIVMNVCPENYQTPDPAVTMLYVPIKSVTTETNPETGEKVREPIIMPFEALINVTDERKFRPKTNREELTEESARQLQKEVDALIAAEIKSIAGIKSYPEYMKSDKKHLYMWAHQYKSTVENLYDMVLGSELKDVLYARVFQNDEGIECCIVDLAECFDFADLVFDASATESVLNEDEKTGKRTAIIAPVAGLKEGAVKAAAAWGIPAP